MQSKHKILIYVRNYFKKTYLTMFNDMSGINIHYLTDFPNNYMQNLRDDFNKNMVHEQDLYFKDIDENDVICRCRLLRNLNKNLSLRMLRAMQKTIENILINGGYTFVVGQMVDDYITHLMSLVCDRLGINYIGLCSSYFDGCTHVTCGSNGSAIRVRSATKDEAYERFKSINTNTFRQDYSQPNTYDLCSHVIRSLKYHSKQIVFPLMKIYRNDPYNYHYMAQPYVGQIKSISNYVNSGAFHNDWQNRAYRTQNDMVYIPLSFIPEATTDYWIKDISWIQYENKLLDLVYSLSAHFTIVVKEHVHMLGIRSKKFYAKLLEIDNVISIPPFVNSNSVISDFSPIILTGGGSAGVEATIRSKRLVTYCDSSYWIKPSLAKLIREENLMDIVSILKQVSPANVDPVLFLQDCLKSTLSFDYMKDRYLNTRYKHELYEFFENLTVTDI